MARIARAVAPGIPHHIAQRGNKRQQTFFNDQDYQAYLEVTPTLHKKDEENLTKHYGLWV
jgi:REP element-mobilizing transposase RayT